MELPNDILAFLLGVIALLSIIAGVFRWKITQIQNDTKYNTTARMNTSENHKDINHLKEMVIALQTTLSDLCDRISRMEGAFNQHNREKGDH